MRARLIAMEAERLIREQTMRITLTLESGYDVFEDSFNPDNTLNMQPGMMLSVMPVVENGVVQIVGSTDEEVPEDLRNYTPVEFKIVRAYDQSEHGKECALFDLEDGMSMELWTGHVQQQGMNQEQIRDTWAEGSVVINGYYEAKDAEMRELRQQVEDLTKQVAGYKMEYGELSAPKRKFKKHRRNNSES